jgi:hypothetical protein
MTEFKQIVGRGTRVHEDTKKYYFTLIDFRKATNHFADPDVDGEPVQIYEPREDESVTPPDDVPPTDDGEELIPPKPGQDEEVIVDYEPPVINIPPGVAEPPKKYYIFGKPVRVLAERIDTWMKTASSSPKACAIIRRRPFGNASPVSTISLPAGTELSASRLSSKNWRVKACSLTRWPRTWVRTSTLSTSSATWPSTSPR